MEEQVAEGQSFNNREIEGQEAEKQSYEDKDIEAKEPTESPVKAET